MSLLFLIGVASIVFNAASQVCMGWYKYVYGTSVASFGQGVITRINDAMCTNLLSFNSAIWNFYFDYAWLFGGKAFTRGMIADVWGIAKFFCRDFRNKEPITDPEAFAEVFAGQIERCWTITQGSKDAKFPNPDRHPLGDKFNWRCAEIYYDFTDVGEGSDYVSLSELYNTLASNNTCGEERSVPALLYSPYALDYIAQDSGIDPRTQKEECIGQLEGGEDINIAPREGEEYGVEEEALCYSYDFISDYFLYLKYRSKFDSIWWVTPKREMEQYYSSVINNPYPACLDELFIQGVFTPSDNWDDSAGEWAWNEMTCCTGLYNKEMEACDCDGPSTLISGNTDNVVPQSASGNILLNLVSIITRDDDPRWDSGVYQFAPYEISIDPLGINNVINCGTERDEFLPVEIESGNITASLTYFNNVECGRTSGIPFTEALCSIKNIKSSGTESWPYSRENPEFPGTDMSAISGCGKVVIRYFDYLEWNQIGIDPNKLGDDFVECDNVDVFNNYDSNFLSNLEHPWPVRQYGVFLDAPQRDIIAVCIKRMNCDELG